MVMKFEVHGTRKEHQISIPPGLTVREVLALCSFEAGVFCTAIIGSEGDKLAECDLFHEHF